jgi:hypothetical protein
MSDFEKALKKRKKSKKSKKGLLERLRDFGARKEAEGKDVEPIFDKEKMKKFKWNR